MGGIFEFEEGCSGQVGRLVDCSRAAIYLACGRTIPVSVRRKPRNVMGSLWGRLEFPRIDQVVLVAKVDRKILVAGVVGRSVWSFNHGYGSS